MRSDRSSRGISCRVRIDDADNARQRRLRERADEDPATDES